MAFPGRRTSGCQLAPNLHEAMDASIVSRTRTIPTKVCEHREEHAQQHVAAGVEHALDHAALKLPIAHELLDIGRQLLLNAREPVGISFIEPDVESCVALCGAVLLKQISLPVLERRTEVTTKTLRLNFRIDLAARLPHDLVRLLAEVV